MRMLMEHVALGATDLRVSRLGVGTAAFGLDRYGIPTPGEGSVDPTESIANIHRAIEGGVNFFDTAPAYGRSEELLGEALASHTKIVWSPRKCRSLKMSRKLHSQN